MKTLCEIKVGITWHSIKAQVRKHLGRCQRYKNVCPLCRDKIASSRIYGHITTRDCIITETFTDDALEYFAYLWKMERCLLRPTKAGDSVSTKKILKAVEWSIPPVQENRTHLVMRALSGAPTILVKRALKQSNLGRRLLQALYRYRKRYPTLFKASFTPPNISRRLKKRVHANTETDVGPRKKFKTRPRKKRGRATHLPSESEAIFAKRLRRTIVALRKEFVAMWKDTVAFNEERCNPLKRKFQQRKGYRAKKRRQDHVPIKMEVSENIDMEEVIPEDSATSIDIATSYEEPSTKRERSSGPPCISPKKKSRRNGIRTPKTTGMIGEALNIWRDFANTSFVKEICEWLEDKHYAKSTIDLYKNRMNAVVIFLMKSPQIKILSTVSFTMKQFYKT